MATRIIYSIKDIYFVKDLGGRCKQATSVRPLLREAEIYGITRLSVAHSGLYYERRNDGWYLTSDTEMCDSAHGLPPAGRLIKV